MNFFPGIHETKRAKKTTSFSNPLTGALYSNREFLKNCKNLPKSISDLDHVKQLKYEPNKDQSFKKQRKLNQKRQNLDTTDCKRIQREIIAVHATSRMAEPVSKTFNQGFVIKNKCKKALDSDTLEHIQKIKMNKTFGSTRFSALSHHEISKLESKKSQMIPQLQNNGIATFDDIQILILDLLTEKQDFRTKIIRINLQKYFRSFFKKQLSGHFTNDFLNKVQHYIEELLFQQKIDQKIEQHLYPIELFTISSRMVFMNKLLEFESRKTASNEDNIRTLIRFYCVPSKEFRQSCLRDILLMLSIEVYEKFNLSRQQQYVLLDENGQEITQILQVKFSTKKLFLTSKNNSAKNFTNYIKLLDEYYREGKKLSFTENIKLNFRQRLAQGKVDESHFNYTENYEMEKLKRLMELDTAEHILKKRIDTHRLNKFTPKEDFIVLNQRNESKNKSWNKLQPGSNQNMQVGPISQLPQKSKFQDPTQNQFWRMANNRISPEAKPKSSSPSPQRRSKSPIKTQTSMRASSQLSKQKFKEFLQETKTNSLNASVEKNIREEFRDLVSKNDIYDFRFNQNLKNRVMKAVLKDLFVYFNNKSDLQIDKIIKAVKEMDVRLDEQFSSKIKEQGENQNDEQDSLQQFVGQNENENAFSHEERIQQINNSLSQQEFRNLRIAVGCSEPKQVIMNFVAKYLNFNEFGQLSKEQLFYQVEIILGEKTQRGTVEVIAEVIWSWFEANSIVQNDFIRRITLESWYEKYKIVYCMLTSLIFGTNHKTIIDLAYQVLA